MIEQENISDIIDKNDLVNTISGLRLDRKSGIIQLTYIILLTILLTFLFSSNASILLFLLPGISCAIITNNIINISFDIKHLIKCEAFIQ